MCGVGVEETLLYGLKFTPIPCRIFLMEVEERDGRREGGTGRGGGGQRESVGKGRGSREGEWKGKICRERESEMEEGKGKRKGWEGSLLWVN